MQDHRSGALGACIDLYEQQLEEFKKTVGEIPADKYDQVFEHYGDPECKSFRAIVTHVVSCGYGYSNRIRKALAIEETPRPTDVELAHAGEELDKMMQHTLYTFEGRWNMTDQELAELPVHWKPGDGYNAEDFLEHGIVHLMRHRRQIRRLLNLT